MNSLIREVTWIERLNKEDGKKKSLQNVAGTALKIMHDTHPIFAY